MAGALRFKPRVSCPRLCDTLASLNILQSRLRLLHDQGSRQFDQLFGQPLAFLPGDHGRVVPR